MQVDPALQAAAVDLLRRWQVILDGPGSLLVESANVTTVNAALGSGGVWATQVNSERSGLEETFLRLTGESSKTEMPDATSAC